MHLLGSKIYCGEPSPFGFGRKQMDCVGACHVVGVVTYDWAEGDRHSDNNGVVDGAQSNFRKVRCRAILASIG